MSQQADEPDVRKPDLSPLISISSGAGIGLMVGAMLGLAMSPTVATFTGAIGAVLAALLGLNDQHFSASKGLRIGAFGLFALIGAAVGLYAKNYGVFAPSLEEKKRAITAAGFSDCQALDLLSGLSLRLTPPEDESNLEERKRKYLSLGYTECQALGLLARRPAAAESPAGESGEGAGGRQGTMVESTLAASGLMASEVEISACSRLRALNDESLPLEAVSRAFTAAGPGWKGYAESVGNTKLDPKEKVALLLIGKDAACSGGDLPSAPDCDKLRAADTESGQALREAFAKIEAVAPARKRVESSIDADADQTTALHLIVGALCGSH